jgi:nucleotide-binding universal stress UspA family protein
MTKILIAVDDTEHSLRAARTAHSVFGDDADFLVINVGGFEATGWAAEPMYWGVAYPAMLPGVSSVGTFPLVVNPSANNEGTGSNAVDRAEQVAGDIAVSADIPAATPLGDVGDPVPAILRAAETHDVDVIVVGASHAGWFARLIAPPVAAHVLKGSDRPVLVVP